MTDDAQQLVPGVRPITTADRLDVLARRPMQPKRQREQQPADHGLFDLGARGQQELFGKDEDR